MGSSLLVDLLSSSAPSSSCPTLLLHVLTLLGKLRGGREDPSTSSSGAHPGGAFEASTCTGSSTGLMVGSSSLEELTSSSDAERDLATLILTRARLKKFVYFRPLRELTCSQSLASELSEQNGADALKKLTCELMTALLDCLSPPMLWESCWHSLASKPSLLEPGD